MVDAAGHISLNEQVMELPVLKKSLVAMKASDPDTSVVVRGAAEVD